MSGLRGVGVRVIELKLELGVERRSWSRRLKACSGFRDIGLNHLLAAVKCIARRRELGRFIDSRYAKAYIWDAMILMAAE